jgi:hypothetical protein
MCRSRFHYIARSIEVAMFQLNGRCSATRATFGIFEHCEVSPLFMLPVVVRKPVPESVHLNHVLIS